MKEYSDEFRAEIKKGYLDAVGDMADYRIRLNAGGWVDKDVLTEEDFLEICHAIEAQYIVPEVPQEEVTEPTEKITETTEEVTEEATEPTEEVIENLEATE